jgi:ABC-type amino acid transport substrate-binding protein
MKLNYSLGIMGMIGTLFLNYPGFTQVTKFDVNQGTSKPPKIYFGLQTDSAPISDKDPVGNWQGYCIAFIEILEKQTHLNIVRVPIESQDRFTGIGNHGQKLDAECGSDTITERSENQRFKKSKW